MDELALASELSHAIAEMSLRGLKQSKVWAAELLCSLNCPERDVMAAMAESGLAPSRGASSAPFLLAKSYFDCGEFSRAAHVLSSPAAGAGLAVAQAGGGGKGGQGGQGGGNNDNGRQQQQQQQQQRHLSTPTAGLGTQLPLLRFLRCYALYLAGERRREEEAASFPLPPADLICACQRHVADNTHPFLQAELADEASNRNLSALHSELTLACSPPWMSRYGGEGGSGGDEIEDGDEGDVEESETPAEDGALLYLHGVVLRDMGLPSEAAAALCRSVNAWPWKWVYSL